MGFGFGFKLAHGALFLKVGIFLCLFFLQLRVDARQQRGDVARKFDIRCVGKRRVVDRFEHRLGHALHKAERWLVRLQQVVDERVDLRGKGGVRFRAPIGDDVFAHGMQDFARLTPQVFLFK